MSYDNGEELALTQIRAADSFNSKNAFRGRYIKHNTNHEVVAIIRPGPFAISEDSGLGGGYSITWVSVCEIWVKIGQRGMGRALEQLQLKRQEIIDRFHLHFRGNDLTNTVRDMEVTEAGDLYTRETDRKVWVVQDISIQWMEDYNVTVRD
jgi:hypothetical protein